MDQVKMGKLIANLRKEKEMTQDELGDLLGVGSKAVSKWECGISTPDISLLSQLSDILEVEIGDLLKGKKSITKSEQEEIERIQNIKNEKKRRIKHIILLILFLFYSTMLIYIERNKVKNEFEPVVFESSDENYSISGRILSTNTGKMIILNNLAYKGENKGTDKEPLVKSVQIFVKKEEEIILNYNFCEIMDDYGKVKYYNLSEILDNLPIKVYDLGETNFTKNQKLTFELTYIDKNDKEIKENINLDTIF